MPLKAKANSSHDESHETYVSQAFGGGNCSGSIDVSTCLTHPVMRQDFDTETFIAHTLRGEGHDASEDGTGRGTPIVPCYAIQERAVSENVNAGPQGKGYQEGIAYTLEARGKSQSVAYQCHDGNVDPMGTLRGTSVSNVPFLAFAQNQRDELRLLDIAGALSAEPGMKQQTFVHHQAVRRLTPRECERLQGFPEVVHQMEFKWSIDNQNNSVNVEVSNHKEHWSAGNAEKGKWQGNAKSAVLSFDLNGLSIRKPAHSDVHINCGELGAVCLSRNGLSWSVASAAEHDTCRLRMPIESFVRSIVGMSSLLDQTILIGKAESPPNRHPSIRLKNGKMLASLYGDEITRRAKDALSGSCTTVVPPMKFTTLDHLNSSNIGSMFQILFCCVLDATTGCIPAKTSDNNSCCLTIESRQDWTRYGHDGREISNSARYRMLGNAVTCNVIEWIGKRMLEVDQTDHGNIGRGCE